jgi:hypothetical protein
MVHNHVRGVTAVELSDVARERGIDCAERDVEALTAVNYVDRLHGFWVCGNEKWGRRVGPLQLHDKGKGQRSAKTPNDGKADRQEP